MNQSQAEYLPTRQSLIERLRRWDDQESWRDFFDLYWGLLYGTAMKSGLNDPEAQDVAQDTIILVAKKMSRFKYDPAVDRLEAFWEEEWARTLWAAALARVKEQVAPKQFQMFDLYVVKERPAPEVAQALGVAIAQVYLAKHRISALLKKELTQLKTRLE